MSHSSLVPCGNASKYIATLHSPVYGRLDDVGATRHWIHCQQENQAASRHNRQPEGISGNFEKVFNMDQNRKNARLCTTFSLTSNRDKHNNEEPSVLMPTDNKNNRAQIADMAQLGFFLSVQHFYATAVYNDGVCLLFRVSEYLTLSSQRSTDISLLHLLHFFFSLFNHYVQSFGTPRSAEGSETNQLPIWMLDVCGPKG